MTRVFRNLSLKTKLILLSTAGTSMTLVLCCLGFAVNDVRAILLAKVKELDVQADIVGFNSTAVLTFEDAPAARRLLRSLHLQPTIEMGCLYTPAGEVLAEFQRDPRAPLPPPPLKGEGFHRLPGKQLELFRRVHDGGEVVGTLYLRSNMHDMYSQLWMYGMLATFLAFTSLAAGIVLAFRLQQTITGPIHRLTDAARQISKDKDYSVRLERDSGNELGTLIEAFNAMLHQIQASEAALQAAHDELEDRVHERTAQLRAEIAVREKAERDLVRAKEAAEAANQAKSRFLANMSHEIRTPLNAVLGFTQLLRRGADQGNEAERREYLDTIHTSGQHLLALINDILDLSKVESGKLEIETMPCVPHEIISEVISVLRVRACERGLRLDCEWPAGVPETIPTDPARLRQLLMNLVGNALKFTKVGGVTIVARPVREGPRAQLAIAVIDTGIGIPPDKLESIFDPFVQADNSVTREFGGTGLGLAICRRIAAALGGTLTVESELGRGSTFTATVDIGSWDDVRILEAPPADGVTPRRHEQPANITQLPPGRIPLVEDGDTNRKLISLILQRAGAEVTTAENGQVAVDLAAQQSFDLILMDMQMPVMDGYTASRRLRQAGVDAPIIALTAHAMKGDDKHCREAGCSGYLTKPVDADQLLCTVADALSVGGGSVGRPTCDGPSAHASVRATGPALISTLPADDPDFREIVEEFVRHLAERLEAMRAAWAARNLHELRHLAHWLKGTGGTAGFPAFNEPARQLEAAAKGGQHAGIEPLIAELTALAARIEISATRCPRTAGSDFGDVLVPRAALVCS